jgi:hypothetical protein
MSGQRTGHGVDREHAAIEPSPAQMGGVGHAVACRRGAQLLDHGCPGLPRHRRRVGLHQQVVKCHAFERARQIAEQPFGPYIGARHPIVERHQHDPVRGLFENTAQERFAALDGTLGFTQRAFGAFGFVAFDRALA